MMKDMNVRVQEAQGIANQMNSKISTITESIVKFSKAKDRVLKAARKKQLVMYKGASVRLTVNFSSETIQSRRQWDVIFKVLKLKTKTKPVNKEFYIQKRNPPKMKERLKWSLIFKKWSSLLVDLSNKTC